MTAKDYLKQITLIEAKIAHRREQIAQLKEKATATGSLSARGDPVQTSKTQSVLEEKVVKYADLERQVEELLFVLEGRKNEAISEIHKLEDKRYIDVLYMHYVQGMKLGTVARRMNYSYGRIKHLIREAERELEKVSTF